MPMRGVWTLLRPAALAVATVACQAQPPADPSQLPVHTFVNVWLHNASSVPVYVQEVPGSALPLRRLSPGETQMSSWMTPRGGGQGSSWQKTVEGTDEAGNLVFCHRFTLEELERSGRKAEVVAGKNTCR